MIVGFYLGTPVLIHADLGGGWVDAQYPDRENPGRAHRKPKPYTFTGRGPDAWRGRMWRDQIQPLAEIGSPLSEPRPDTSTVRVDPLGSLSEASATPRGAARVAGGGE